MLISLRNKLACLNGMITPEANDRLKDELGRIFTVAKMHQYKQGGKYGHLAMQSLSQSTGLYRERDVDPHHTF